MKKYEIVLKFKSNLQDIEGYWDGEELPREETEATEIYTITGETDDDSDLVSILEDERPLEMHDYIRNVIYGLNDEGHDMFWEYKIIGKEGQELWSDFEILYYCRRDVDLDRLIDYDYKIEEITS